MLQARAGVGLRGKLRQGGKGKEAQEYLCLIHYADRIASSFRNRRPTDRRPSASPPRPPFPQPCRPLPPPPAFTNTGYTRTNGAYATPQGAIDPRALVLHPDLRERIECVLLGRACVGLRGKLRQGRKGKEARVYLWLINFVDRIASSFALSLSLSCCAPTFSQLPSARPAPARRVQASCAIFSEAAVVVHGRQEESMCFMEKYRHHIRWIMRLKQI